MKCLVSAHRRLGQREVCRGSLQEDYTMGNITAKVLAHDDMPCRAMASIEFFLDMCCDILLDIVFLKGSVGDVD